MIDFALAAERLAQELEEGLCADQPCHKPPGGAGDEDQEEVSQPGSEGATGVGSGHRETIHSLTKKANKLLSKALTAINKKNKQNTHQAHQNQTLIMN